MNEYKATRLSNSINEYVVTETNEESEVVKEYKVFCPTNNNTEEYAEKLIKDMINTIVVE